METKEDIQTEEPASEQAQGQGLGSSKDLGASWASSETPSSRARITEIDISGPAAALGTLRISDKLLVFGCGINALSNLFGLVLGLVLIFVTGDSGTELVSLVVGGLITAAVFAFSAYTGWRHIGIIDQRVWQSYLWVFPLLVIVSVYVALMIVSDPVDQGQAFSNAIADRKPDLLPAMFVLTLTVLVSISAFVCVLLLRRMRIQPIGVGLVDLLSSLEKCSGISRLELASRPKKSISRGLNYAISGAVVLLIGVAYPNIKVYALASVLGCFLLVRARRYFQVDAESLLAVDERPPILFLRSFSDDEKRRYRPPDRALLDYSLETRLANHFHRFGPFIAIGSPQEPLPQPGAAKVILDDDQWQHRVLGWMREARIIIMYSGTTDWVNWELRKVVESGRSTSLILMFPEIKGWWSSRRKRNILTRVEHIREVYKDTPWNEELMEYRDFAKVRAMLFREDGSMVMIKSQTHERDAYHLAALISHYLLLYPANTQTSTVNNADKSVFLKC